MKTLLIIILSLFSFFVNGQVIEIKSTSNSVAGGVIRIGRNTANSGFTFTSYNVSSDGSAWEDVGIEIILSGSQIDVDYILQKRSGVNFINKDTLTGTGSALSFGNYDSTGTYKIRAYTETQDSLMNDSAVIAIRYYATAAKTLFARMTTQPSNVRKQLYSLTIDSLNTYGIWTKAKILYFTAAGNRQISLLNWISTSFNLDTISSLTYTKDVGWAGNGTDSYLNTGFKDLTNGLATNNSTWAIWMASAGTNSSTKHAFGTRKTTSGIDLVALVNNSSTSARATFFSDSLQYNKADYAGYLGLFAVSSFTLTNDSIYWLYNGGILTRAKRTTRGKIANDYNIYLSCNDVYGTASNFQTAQISFFMRGLSLTEQNKVNFILL